MLGEVDRLSGVASAQPHASAGSEGNDAYRLPSGSPSALSRRRCWFGLVVADRTGGDLDLDAVFDYGTGVRGTADAAGRLDSNGWRLPSASRPCDSQSFADFRTVA